MIYEMPMPSLGADMDEAKMVEWKIKPGDTVKKHQIIASIETTKSVIDVESFHEGKITEILAHIGDVIQVGHPILKMETAEEIVATTITQLSEVKPSAQRLKISPAAKKMAEENHVDLSQLKGTGPEGEIMLKDVESKIAAAPEKSYKGINLREAIAALMTKSKKEIPHYYVEREIRLDSFMNWIDEKNKALPVDDRLLVPATLMKAIILALKKFPQLNGYYKNANFEMKNEINLGIAFSIKEGGVMAPAVLEADKMILSEFNKAVMDLAQRTRKGGLKNREMSDGTITVTNVGDLGSDSVFGIIFPPQVSIVGLGRIRKAPLVDRDDKIQSGLVIDITLSADHRVSDGLYGARFLNEVDQILNSPSLLES